MPILSVWAFSRNALPFTMKFLNTILVTAVLVIHSTGFCQKAGEAVPVDRIKVPEGFSVERLYSVPRETQGSWVALTIDDQQRFIVSDQYGSLYRFPAPGRGEVVEPDQVEKIPVDIGAAQGLLFAFDSLYVVVNAKEFGGRGLYRITDSDGDDQFDKKELLRKFEEKGGEHGPHAVVLGPDGESLYIVVGNQTAITEFDSSRVPMVWDEDLLLERPYGRGFMKGTPAPGGWIAKTDPDGKTWELVATGFRNQYDIAFNRHGDMFTYDADMEWDVNTPWYRPTRINHVVSGAEFGWRNGGGKWPEYYTDSVGAVVNVGPGSPTGVAFGYGTDFPDKYQEALFVADWSYGILYAIHLEASGGSYAAKVEKFINAQPMPLTDLIVNPDDACLYFTIGGRRVQSGFYRVVYNGEDGGDDQANFELTPEMTLRRKLESYHRKTDGAADEAWQALAHPDRSIRFAARIALEHQPFEEWKARLQKSENPDEIIQGALAMVRNDDGTHFNLTLDRLQDLSWKDLDDRQRMDWLRVLSVALSRHGARTSEEHRTSLATTLSAEFPVQSSTLNAELLQLLVYLDVAGATAKGIDLLESAPSQEEQLAYAKSLRHQKSGWTRELRSRFFEWFAKAAGYKGGASFEKFVADMKSTAIKNTPANERLALKGIINKQPVKTPLYTPEARPFVKNWQVEDFDHVINVGLEGNRSFENGRKMFGQATCYVCHRFQQDGGALGPDLTSVAGKFSPRDLLESIIHPSREISDQYGQMIFSKKDGSQVIGRIMNLKGDEYRISVDMMDPNNILTVKVADIVSMNPSPVSMMPPGLINTLSEEDVLDLLAYMLSAGDPEHPMFQ